MKKNNGAITLDDLKQYKPVERTPLEGSYRGYEIITAPPPSSGGVGIIQMLNMLEESGYERSGAGSAAAIHYVAETMRRYFADRAAYFGDPDFVSVPVERLTRKGYARQRAKAIDRGRAGRSSEMPPGLSTRSESTETTHYSVVDDAGNAVAVTYTLNGSFGSGVTAVGTGVLLNNEMDDFSSKPGAPNNAGLLTSEQNAIAPGKRPLSSMTPTIAARGGKLFLVVGFTRRPDDHLDGAAGHHQRDRLQDEPPTSCPTSLVFHHQWMPDRLRLERHDHSQDTVERLRRRGHSLSFVEKQGRVMAIQATDQWLLGAADARSEGSAEGY